jgi:diamine N-acetyltransferase
VISYRAPGEGDSEALAALGRETFVETFGHLYHPDDLSSFLSDAYAVEAFAADMTDRSRRTYIASENGRLIGYCKVGLASTFPDYDIADKRVVELKQLYIRQSHQGGGVAPILMEWALDEARAVNADEIALSVWQKNERAQRFYKRYGFGWVADTYFMVGNHRDDEYLLMRPMSD